MGELDFQTLLDWLQRYPEWVAFSIGLIAFLESLAIAGLVMPGVVLLSAVAALAGGGALALTPTLAAGFIGAVLGDGISFLLGHHFRERIQRWWPFSRHPDWLDNGERFFRNHGGKSILIGRFVGPIRPVIPLVAGMLGMSVRRFLLINLLSGLLWAPVYLLPGYLVGASAQSGLLLPDHFGSLAVLVLGLFLLGWWLTHRCHHYLQKHSPLYQRVERWMHQHPQRATLWQLLLDERDGERSFPLASLMLCLFALTAFCLWLLALQTSQWMGTWDHAVRAYLAQLQYPGLQAFFQVITDLGLSWLILLIATPLALALAYNRHVAAALHLALALALTAASSSSLKLLLAVPRPSTPDELIEIFSFPSGHTSLSVTLYGLLASFIAQELPPARRWIPYTVSGLLVLLVAFSRLYLDVHWFSDVVGGVLLGLLVCSATRVSFSRYNRHPIRPTPSLGAGALLAILLPLTLMIGRHWGG